jgi:choloylglycine hydrolase
MAYVVNGYPLYYDAMNEHGLCMAGLAFPGFCFYGSAGKTMGRDISPWELIPYVLTGCRTVDDARARLRDAVLVDRPFSAELQNQPMHWMLSDHTASVVLETDTNGRIVIYDNPAGVMTNAPTFPEQMKHLTKYAHLTPHPKTENGNCQRGMGALGLPGDWSSPSRFVRAAFLRRHMRCDTADAAFSLLDSVKVPRGASYTEDGKPIVTVYSAVMDVRKMAYHYRTEEHPHVRSFRPTPLALRGNVCISEHI